MIPAAVLSDCAKQEIDTLARDGITPTPGEIVMLNYLGQRIETPETRLLLSRGRPVLVGGAILWPLTMYAVEWLDRVCPGVKRFEQSCLVGYAMAFGRGDGHELDTEGREAVRCARKWYWRLRCTRREYEEALTQVDAQDRRLDLPKDPTGKTMTIGDFSAFLSACVGGDPDFWERRCSAGYAVATLSMYVMQNHADKRPCAEDPRIKATRALGLACERIRRRWKEQHGT